VGQADDEYTEFVRARLARWRRTALLICGDWDLGDDVVQRTLTELYRKWPRLRHANNLDGLVRTMLVRRMVEERRSGWARVQLWASVPDRSASQPADPGERMALVAALRQLASRQRAVLVLRFFHDLTVEETAETLGCSTGTVKSQTARGLATLRRLLASPAALDGKG
jgi:RNA polymerase sigma-70 factor (sigma-E family)